MAPFNVIHTLLDMPERNACSSVRVPEIIRAEAPSTVGLVLDL